MITTFTVRATNKPNTISQLAAEIRWNSPKTARQIIALEEVYDGNVTVTVLMGAETYTFNCSVFVLAAELGKLI